jgi:hypothetical protein
VTPDFEQIKQRAEAATPGPWKLWNGWGPLVGEDRMACERIGPDPDDHYEGVGIVPGEGAVDIYASRADFEFVAAARDDIPALLAVIDELTMDRDHHKDLGRQGWARVDELTAQREDV